MSRLPVRLRVTLIFTAVMAVVLAGTGLFLYSRLESELDQSIDKELHSQASQLTSLLRVADAGIGESARRFLRNSRGEHAAQVLTASGRIFDPAHQPDHHQILDPAQAREADRAPIVIVKTGVPGLGSEEARVLAKPIRFEGRRLIVVVGETLTERNHALSSLATLLLAGGPVALLLASLAAYLAVAAALRPVEAMRRRAAEISSAEPDERLPVPPASDELSRLGETLNAMLARLEVAIERERRFVDDASHELRTPLALQRTELEIALRYGETPEDLRSAIASGIEETDRLIRLAEDLLVVARSERGALDLDVTSIEVAPLLEHLQERFESRATEADRPLVVDADGGLRIDGDRLRLEQALTNLVDNALRHGGGEVRIAASDANGRVEIHVTDRGPGFPSDFIDSAFERFTRADPARGRGGTGLGLAIVERIAAAHGGRAQAGTRADGGADVWIEVPGSRPR
jgi:two-component system OmpR family sensor kinase